MTKWVTEVSLFKTNTINFLKDKLLVLFWVDNGVIHCRFLIRVMCFLFSIDSNFPFLQSLFMRREMGLTKSFSVFAGTHWVSRWLHRFEWWYGCSWMDYNFKFTICKSRNMFRLERYFNICFLINTQIVNPLFFIIFINKQIYLDHNTVECIYTDA